MYLSFKYQLINLAQVSGIDIVFFENRVDEVKASIRIFKLDGSLLTGQDYEHKEDALTDFENIRKFIEVNSKVLSI